MDEAFASIGRGVVGHPGKVVVAWVAFLILGVVFAPRLQEVFEREFPGGTQARGYDPATRPG